MRTFFTQGDHKITKTYQFKLPSRTHVLSSPLFVDIRPTSDSQASLSYESRFGWNWYLCIPVTCEFTTRSSCTSSSDEPNLLELDESSPDHWSISKLILNAFKTLLQFQQEALSDVYFEIRWPHASARERQHGVENSSILWTSTNDFSLTITN